MTRRAFSIGAAMFLAAFAHGRTVALWPLNATRNGALDGRCAISPANDLTILSGAESTNAPTVWSVPPNPDPGFHMFTPYDEMAIQCASGSRAIASSSTGSHALFDTLCCTNDFTIEGWVRLDELPVNNYKSIFEARCGGNCIFWSIRQTRKDADNNPIYTIECYWRGNSLEGSPGGDQRLYDIGADGSDWLGKWHHMALERKVVNSNTYLVLFVDGVQVSSTKVGKISQVANENCAIYLGGRSDQFTRCALNYWRVSDEPLDPSQFLNAAGTGGQAYDLHGAKQTVAYWPLSRNADGTLDCRDLAGTADLSAGFHVGDNLGKYYGLSLERGVSAFKGMPPNTAITFNKASGKWASLPDGNQDSFGAFAYQSFCKIYKLGSGGRADPHSNSFTLEVYYRPALREETYRNMAAHDESTATLWTSMNMGTTTNGWALQAVRDANGIAGGTSTWRLLFMDADSTAGDTSTYVAYGDFAGGAFVEGDGVWRHIALTYSKTGGLGGFGQWELFVDGVSCGTVSNARAPTTRTNDDYLYFLGNGGLSGQLYGYVDCIVYSEGAAISPQKFFCETSNPTANDKLKAFLTLDADALNDTLPFTCCVLGNTYFYINQGCYSRTYHPVASADGPTITNPDPVCADGSATGSAEFSVGGSTGDKSILSTRDGRVLSLLASGANDLTLEGYFKRNTLVGASDWDILFFTYGTTGAFNASYRGASSKGPFQLWDYAVNKANDNYFTNDHAAVTHMQDWTHMAWVRKNLYWSLYQNGKLVATLTKGSAKTYIPEIFLIGGRNDERTWCGNIAHLRLSSGALETNEFLCAAAQVRNPAAPAEPDGTLAFWRLDGVDGAADTANSTLADGGFDLAGTAATSSEAAVAPGARRADDSGWFDDSDAGNAGSVSVAAAELVSSALGSLLDTTDSFTAEGWFKRSSAGAVAAEEVICGTWNGSAGWKLSLVPASGGTRFAIHAQSASCIYAHGTFPNIAPSLDGWHHLALAHDAESSIWTLRVDDIEMGTVSNLVRATYGTYGAGDFILGSGSFTGSFDLWRVSRGIRNADGSSANGFKVLLTKPRGTVLLLR